MSKRFTVTEKWEDGWYSDLKPLEKLVFNYICDKCDLAGFWEINIKTAAFQIGVTKSSFLGAIQGLNKAYISNGKYLWIRRFLKHQSNLSLNPNNNAHKHIISILESHTDFEGINFFEELKKTDILGAKQPPCNGSVKVKVKVKGGIVKGGFKPPTLDDVKKYISENPELSNIDPTDFWKGYNDGGWIDTQGKPVRNWRLKLRTRSKYNDGGVGKSSKKTKLFPIAGKTCSKDGCPLPAVYKHTSPAGYDFWYCAEHMPEKVKELYE